MIQPEAKSLEACPLTGPSLWTQETFFPKARGPGSRTKSVPVQANTVPWQATGPVRHGVLD